MSQSAAVWLVVVLAMLAANLPFVSVRLFGVLPVKTGKSMPLRLLELVVLYFAIGGVGLLFEQQAGQIAPQGWEFYAITAPLFLTLGFPGFVWRYLLRH